MAKPAAASQRFQSFDLLATLVAVVRGDGTVLFANSALEDALGTDNTAAIARQNAVRLNASAHSGRVSRCPASIDGTPMTTSARAQNARATVASSQTRRPRPVARSAARPQIRVPAVVTAIITTLVTSVSTVGHASTVSW